MILKEYTSPLLILRKVLANQVQFNGTEPPAWRGPADYWQGAWENYAMRKFKDL